MKLHGNYNVSFSVHRWNVIIILSVGIELSRATDMYCTCTGLPSSKYVRVYMYINEYMLWYACSSQTYRTHSFTPHTSTLPHLTHPHRGRGSLDCQSPGHQEAPPHSLKVRGWYDCHPPNYTAAHISTGTYLLLPNRFQSDMLYSKIMVPFFH